MSLLAALLTLVLLAGVIAVISAPLLAARKPPGDSQAASLAELQLAREAKYRELRDLELDYGTGKLSREDYEATGGALRAEALQILNRVEALERVGSDEAEAAPSGSEG